MDNNSSLPRIEKPDWEPKQTLYNLLLQYPDFELRALAQIYTNTRPKAAAWLEYPDETKISLVTIYTPNSGPETYLPYLNQYAECVLGI